MAGHSKWANIKHRKAAQDALRGKANTKLIRAITVAASNGGGDVSSNPRLRDAIDKALNANMKRDTINKAIARGVGSAEGANVEELRYEGYAPGGIAVLVDCMTDNRNRTVAEVRHAFTKHGGNLGTDGSVAYLFSQRGIISFADKTNEDRILEIALEAGADDIVVLDDHSIDVFTSIDNFNHVKSALLAADLAPVEAQITMHASTQIPVVIEDAEKVLRLVDLLEELDDVHEVFTNAEISTAIMEQLNT